MITYTWEFPRFSAHPSLNGLNNVVHNVEFILSASDGEGHGAQIFGSVGISEPTDPDSFKPFNLLTHSVVEQWVIDAMGEETLADHKANLTNQIEQQKAPVSVVLNKPW
jgi:hypothetical protein